MKFSEVKPFLMAVFTITDDPFQVSRYSFDGTNINYYGYAGYKDTLKVGALIERLDLLEKYGDNRFINWNIIGISDPQKLTRDQAEKLMDAGYKIKSPNHEDAYYCKSNTKGWYHFKNIKYGFWSVTNYIPEEGCYKLYDNEPVKQEYNKDFIYNIHKFSGFPYIYNSKQNEPPMKQEIKPHQRVMLECIAETPSLLGHDLFMKLYEPKEP
jgi:hypothetical protein